MIELGRRLFGLLEIMANGVEVLWSGILDGSNEIYFDINLSRSPDFNKETLFIVVSESGVDLDILNIIRDIVLFDKDAMNHYEKYGSSITCGNYFEIDSINGNNWSISSDLSHIYHVSFLSVPLTQ